MNPAAHPHPNYMGVPQLLGLFLLFLLLYHAICLHFYISNTEDLQRFSGLLPGVFFCLFLKKKKLFQ